MPHKALYLLGTEAPDNRAIAVACKTPNRGYDDRSKGHSIQWDSDFTKMTNDRAAVRAKEEYDKAVLSYRRGDARAAATSSGSAGEGIRKTYCRW